MKYIIVFFIFKQIFSNYCGIDEFCSSCENCWESVENEYCTCHFYNGFCYNNTKNSYSYNTSYLFRYDRNKCLSSYDLEEQCGISDLSSKINDKSFYKFFSFNNQYYLANNNILCYYTINNNEKSNEDLLLEIEVNLNHKNGINKNNNKNLMIIFVQEFNSLTKTLYEINLNEFTNKVNIKIVEYQYISIYISLIKSNEFFSDDEIVSMNIGAKKDNSKALRMKKYKYSIAIICIICIICVASCFIIYIIKYKRNRELMRLRVLRMHNNLNEVGNRIDPQEKKNKLEKLFQTKLKKRKYLKKDNINETTACSICLEEFIENKSIVCITLCKHIFHYDCLHNWLFSENSNCQCPYCNYDLLSDKKPTQRHKKQEIKNIGEKPDKIANQNIINNEINETPKNENENEDNLKSSERVITKFKSNKNSINNNNINNNIENNIKYNENYIDIPADNENNNKIRKDIKENDDDISFESDFNKIKNNENIMKNIMQNNDTQNKEKENNINNDFEFVDNNKNEDRNINNINNIEKNIENNN